MDHCPSCEGRFFYDWFCRFNHVMPAVRRYVKGPMWLHFLIGVSFLCLLNQTPPVIVFSSFFAGLAGGAVPAFAQLASSSYNAALSSPSEDDKI